MKYNLYLTHPEDNTGVVLTPVKRGETLSSKTGLTVVATDDVVCYNLLLRPPGETW